LNKKLSKKGNFSINCGLSKYDTKGIITAIPSISRKVWIITRKIIKIKVFFFL
jgi:hypothetical protein